MSKTHPKISIVEIEKIAALSGLLLDKSELEKYRSQFEAILGFVEDMNRVDTTGVEPTYQVTGLTNVTRTDEIIDYVVTPSELLKNAPAVQNGQIEVGRVL